MRNFHHQMEATYIQRMLMKDKSFNKNLQSLQFEDIASEEINQEDNNLINSEEEDVTPNTEENGDLEQPSSNEEVRPGEKAQTEGEEESVTEKSVPTKVIENQSERKRGMEQNNVLPKLKTRISYRLIMTVSGEK